MADAAEWDESVVVVGAGAGGMAAALFASLKGLRVLLCEKSAMAGGTTSTSAGTIWVVEGVDAIVFTLGSDGRGRNGAETVDYGGVRNVLAALGSTRPRIALMTAIGVTDRVGSYNRTTEAHDWKRRSERLVRASGLPYTIVRPGWFDYNAPDQHRLTLLQGDMRHAGNSSDGVVARGQIAQVLVSSLRYDNARRTTFELVSETGPAAADFDALFAPLDRDAEGALDGVRDLPNMPLDDEPKRVRDDLDAILAHRSAT